jgi:hypothetical protein
MEVDAEKSAVGPVSEGIPVSFQEGNVILSPRVDVTTAQTTVSAADGQTIVIGGLITRSKRTLNRRVPYLSSVPILGFLFRYDQLVAQRTELIIILTPHIVRSEADAERIKQLEGARMSWCLGDANKLHGDMGIHARGSCEHCDMETKVIFPDHDPRGTNPTWIEPDLGPSGPELLPPGNAAPSQQELPLPQPAEGTDRPGEAGPSQGPLLPAPPDSLRMPRGNAPGSGPGRPLIKPITSNSRPTRLPPVVNVNPRRTAVGMTVRSAPRTAVSPSGAAIRTANPVQSARYDNRPGDLAPRRAVVTGKHLPGSVLPGGASDYLAKSTEKK